nr:P-loop NTPase fold protein [Lactococcus cremoris]
MLKKTKYEEERYKTIFLNGAWGTGKTEYLSRTEKHINNGKFICLKFWEQTDERSVITIAFAKIHPILYWSLKFFTVLAVIISILMTPVINLGLGNLFDDWWAKLFGLIALFVAIWQFFKYKSDDFYSYFLKILPTKFSKQKVLILDDFDRIKKEKQEKLYQLFNIIKGQMPIVFVGDFKKISKSEGAYLRKIIDKRVDLPISINPINIWEEYFSQLSMSLNVELSQSFKQLFIEETRNLRGRTQFNMLVNQEFFERNKKGRVQVEQQLLIIYISWFYPELLQGLHEGKQIRHPKSEDKKRLTTLLFPY